MKNALIQIYTGDGKGKTTAALGLALRAAGNNMKVLIIQFLKGRRTGERKILKDIPNIQIENYGTPDFVNKDDIKEVDRRIVRRGLDRAKQALETEDWDMIILDEINIVLDFELIELDDFLNFLKKYGNREVELVLTGRKAPKKIIDAASLVTEMKCIKHPYQEELGPRKGIEY